MFDTLILLSGPAEHAVFATLLRGYNPSLTVLPVFTVADLEAIEPEWLARARLVALGDAMKVPAAVVAQLGYGAYNFHPGSPRYPGDAPALDAIDDGASDFGCTMHRMTAWVDAGPIIEVELFAIPPAASVSRLEEMAYAAAVQMFWRMARVLATQPAPLIARAVRWSQAPRLRANHERGRKVSPVTSSNRVAHRIDSLCADPFGIVPSMVPHGSPLRLVKSERDVDATPAVALDA